MALSLKDLGLGPRQAFELISDPIIGQRQTEDEPGDGIVDSSDRLEGGGVITWWNDIEKDKRYLSFTSQPYDGSDVVFRYKSWPEYPQAVRGRVFIGNTEREADL